MRVSSDLVDDGVVRSAQDLQMSYSDSRGSSRRRPSRACIVREGFPLSATARRWALRTWLRRRTRSLTAGSLHACHAGAIRSVHDLGCFCDRHRRLTFDANGRTWTLELDDVDDSQLDRLSMTVRVKPRWKYTSAPRVVSN